MGFCCKMLIFVYFTQIGTGPFVYFSPSQGGSLPRAAEPSPLPTPGILHRICRGSPGKFLWVSVYFV